jgi:hypothetical protein
MLFLLAADADNVKIRFRFNSMRNFAFQRAFSPSVINWLPSFSWRLLSILSYRDHLCALEHAVQRAWVRGPPAGGLHPGGLHRPWVADRLLGQVWWCCNYFSDSASFFFLRMIPPHFSRIKLKFLTCSVADPSTLLFKYFCRSWMSLL